MYQGNSFELQYTRSNPIAVVTGGGGFIGQALLRQLLAAGWMVRNLDFTAGKISDDRLSHWQGSFTDQNLLHEAMVGADCIFHLASTHFPKEANSNPYADCESSVLGIIAMANMAINLKVRRIVFASSGGTVYGPLCQIPVSEDHPTYPITAYGISKLSSEHYLRFFNNQGIETVSLRIANPYGPGQNIRKAQGALTTFCYHAARGLPIVIWGDGTIERDFVHVEDVARALVIAANSPVRGAEINIGSGKGISLNNLLDIIRENGFSLQVKYEEARIFDIPRSVLCVDRARDLLGWMPEINIKEGVSGVIKDFCDIIEYQ